MAKDVSRAAECSVHGKPKRSADLMLRGMLVALMALVCWHVAAYGVSFAPSGDAPPGFLGQLFWEVRWLLLSKHGILAEVWGVMPYFMLGILLAGWIRTYRMHIRLRRMLDQYGNLGIFFAATIGVFSPLCSCGILSTVVSMLSMGIPLAPTIALLLASPLMSPTAYFLTISDLGPQWATIRVLASLLMGVMAGFITKALAGRGFRTEEIFVDEVIPYGDFHDPEYPDERLRCICNVKLSNRLAASGKSKFIVFLAKVYEMIFIVGKYVLVGIAVGSVVENYLPAEILKAGFSADNSWGIVGVTLASVPIFLHQISASSILVHIKNSLPGTIDHGAALAFLIGGPVTAIPALVVLWTMFKKKVFFLYLTISICGTIVLSYLFQFFLFPVGLDFASPLFAGVESISGGAYTVVAKLPDAEYVAMIADPDQRLGLLACYDDYVSGSSGVVFDGNSLRLRPAVGAQNKIFLANVAQWLRETSVDSSNYKIALLGGAKALPTLLGYQLEAISPAQLATDHASSFGQIWVDGGGLVGLPQAELDAVVAQLSALHQSGVSLYLLAEPQKDAVAISQVSSQWGVRFNSQRAAKVAPLLQIRYPVSALGGIGSWIQRFFKSSRSLS